MVESVALRDAVPGTDMSVSVVSSDNPSHGPTYYGATLYYVDKLILSSRAYDLAGGWRVHDGRGPGTCLLIHTLGREA